MPLNHPSLAAIDTEAVQEAVDILDDAGFDVTGIDAVERVHHGVQFDLRVEANTRSKGLQGDADG